HERRPVCSRIRLPVICGTAPTSIHWTFGTAQGVSSSLVTKIGRVGYFSSKTPSSRPLQNEPRCERVHKTSIDAETLSQPVRRDSICSGDSRPRDCGGEMPRQDSRTFRHDLKSTSSGESGSS